MSGRAAHGGPPGERPEPDGHPRDEALDALAGAADPGAGRGGHSDLFGRGMLYVLVWSAQTVVAIVVSPILTRALPLAEFGSLAAAIALFQMLSLLAVFGLDQALEMQRVEDDDDSRARGLLAVGIVQAALVTTLAAATSQAWAPGLGFPSGGGIVVVTLLWTAPGAVVLMSLSLLQAEDRLVPFTIVGLFTTVGGQVFGLALLLCVERTALVYAWGGVIGQFAAMALGLAWTRPRWRGLLDTPTIRRAMALGVPLVLASVSHLVLGVGDRFIVQRQLGEEQVARYQVAFTVGNVMALVLAFLNRAWLPRLKSIADSDQRWEAIRRSRDGLYWLLGFALLGVTVAAPTLLRVFAPTSYGLDDLALVVFVVALAAVPTTAMGATGRYLVTVRDSRPLAWASVVAVAVKLVTTFALLGPLGLVGAALGTVLGIAAQALVLRVAISGHVRVGRSSPLSLIVLGGCLLLCAGSLALPTTPAWVVGRFGLAALCLVPFVMTLRALQHDRIPAGSRQPR